MDKQYRINNVQVRDSWTGNFGTFSSFALQLDGNDGWVELSQKPETAAPVVGAEIFGHIEVQTRGSNTFQKFKKANPQNSPHQNSVGSISKEDVAYIVMMLEELTLRREQPDNPVARKQPDVVPTVEEVDKATEDGFDLSAIPF